MLKQNSWKQNNVHYEVPYEGQDLISLRWVCSLKHNDYGIISQARLLQRGFKIARKIIYKKSLDELIISFCLFNRNSPYMLQILKKLFYRAKIYLEISTKEGKKNSVWKLDKCIYRLADASRVWYGSLKAFLLSTDLHMS